MRWNLPEEPPMPKKGDKRYDLEFAWLLAKIENKWVLWEKYWNVWEYNCWPQTPNSPQWVFKGKLLKENKPNPENKKKSNNWMDE